MTLATVQVPETEVVFFSAQCWLKKQKDVLVPDRQGGGEKVMWTSGLIFGQGQVVIYLIRLEN